MAKVVITVPNTGGGGVEIPHNDLDGLQGLGPDYIHLNQTEYDAVVSIIDNPSSGSQSLQEVLEEGSEGIVDTDIILRNSSLSSNTSSLILTDGETTLDASNTISIITETNSIKLDATGILISDTSNIPLKYGGDYTSTITDDAHIVNKKYVDNKDQDLVPYTGATQNVDLGTYNVQTSAAITSNGISDTTYRAGQIYSSTLNTSLDIPENTTAYIPTFINGTYTAGSDGNIVVPFVDQTYVDAADLVTLSDANSYTDSGLSTKQNTLVSGTNIITINGNTLLGSGDLTISSGTPSDATTTTKGIMQLAGDLGGTAALPTVIQATETAAGKIEIATQTETNTGTDDLRAITPLKYKTSLDSRFTAFTTDTIVEGTIKRTFSINTVQPTSANTLRIVTSPTVTSATDNTGMTSAGVFGRIGGIPFSLTQNQRVWSTAKWSGDSEMAAYLLTSGQQGYLTKVTNQFGWNAINNATPGDRLIDKYKGLLDTDIAEIRFVGLGTNDARQYTTAGSAAYGNLMRGYLLSSYTSFATTGQQMTLSGTDWTNATFQSNTTTGVQTTVNGATATFKKVGTTIYLTIPIYAGGTATYTVTIDGVSKTVLTNNDSAAFSTLGYPNPSGGAAVAYYPYTHRFDGLSAGEHTVVVTKTGGGTLGILWALSNKQIAPNMTYRGISQYVIPITKMQPGIGNTTSGTGYAFWGGSDATIDAYNSAAKSVIYEFNDDGLDVRLLDINQVFNPYITGYLQSDLLHFTALANKDIADFMISKLTAYPVREQQKLDRLDEYLATKLSSADLSNYATLNGNNNFTGTFNTFAGIRVPSIFNSSGSNTQGQLSQSSSVNGWGSIRNSTSAIGAAFYAQQSNTAAVGDIANWLNGVTGIVAGVRVDGRTFGATPTATNDFTTKAYVDALQLTATATLDFPLTAPATSSDLTITVTGAVLGDVVAVGTPAPAANTFYTGFVSATNTVTVRYNNYSAVAVNPASDTFKVKVLK